METNSSYGTSWADQWDYGDDPHPAPHENKKSSGRATAKYSKKFGESFNKTKAAACTGAKKVKEGASVGIHWLKLKYHKTTQKH